MPYETVQEKVVQTKIIRVCAQCRVRLPDDSRQKMKQVGGLGGSLGASLGGSILLGSVLGPVGAIGGAIAGSFAGHAAGRQASDKLADMTEEELCQVCKSNKQRSDSSEKPTPSMQQQASSGAAAAGEKIGEVASAAGREINNGLSWIKQSVADVMEKKNNDGGGGNGGNPPSGGSSGNQTSGFL